MTNQELTDAFVAALTEYTSVPFREPINNAAAQYFFWAGAQFGIECTQKIHKEVFARPAKEDVEGVAV